MTEKPELLQHVFGGDDEFTPWRVLVVTILLQRTTGPQAREAATRLFARWKTPDSLSSASLEAIEEVVKPCGLASRRAKVLQNVTERYVDWLWDQYVPDPGERGEASCPPPELVTSWDGIGDYTLDAYRIIVFGDLSNEPKDRALLEYWKWAKEKTTSGE